MVEIHVQSSQLVMLATESHYYSMVVLLFLISIFFVGPDGEQLFSFPLKKMMDLDNILQLGSSDEQDDAEVDYMKSSEPSSSGTNSKG